MLHLKVHNHTQFNSISRGIAFGWVSRALTVSWSRSWPHCKVALTHTLPTLHSCLPLQFLTSGSLPFNGYIIFYNNRFPLHIHRYQIQLSGREPMIRNCKPHSVHSMTLNWFHQVHHLHPNVWGSWMFLEMYSSLTFNSGVKYVLDKSYDTKYEGL